MCESCDAGARLYHATEGVIKMLGHLYECWQCGCRVRSDELPEGWQESTQTNEGKPQRAMWCDHCVSES